MSLLRSLDMYRKVPKDLSRGTLTGATLSFIGAVLMFVLFCYEFGDYMTSHVSSTVVIDDQEDEMLTINFNVSLARLPCKFASVNIENILHTHRAHIDVDNSDVRKFTLHTHHNEAESRFLGEEVADEDFEHVAPTVVTHEGDPDGAAAIEGEAVGKPLEHVEVDAQPAGLAKLDKATFAAFLKGKEYALVDFMAPWCIWSKRLAPVWAQFAERAQEKYGRRVGVAEVDCTRQEAQELCREHHITGFPTIVGFARGGTHSHDYYNGDRTAEAFSAFIDAKLAQLKEADEVEAQDEREARTRRLERVRNRGKPPPAEGCQLWGTVRVRKVPGNLVIASTSETHSFDMSRVNLSHTVHHLSFGQEFNDVERSVMPPELSSAMTSLDGVIFNSTGQNMTHEHYLKVVNTRFEYLNLGNISAYKYTSYSAQYHGTTHLPLVKFTYDISPMGIVVEEKYKPLYSFLTSVCAIVGGMFTVFGLFDSVVYETNQALTKKMSLGKHR